MRAGDLAAHGIGDALRARAAAATSVEVREQAQPTWPVPSPPAVAQTNAAELRRRLEVATQRRYVRRELAAIASIIDHTHEALRGMQDAITELTSR